MWSFNRLRDAALIKKEDIIWQGPFSWPGFEKDNNLASIPNVQGVYLFSFNYMDGYILYTVGHTNSTKKRLSAHTREYKKGKYNVLDAESAQKGERKEIWHGWKYAKTHKDEFVENQETILNAVDKQLRAFRIFIVEIMDIRKRERIEAAIIYNIYVLKQPWSELADRGMFLKGRYTSEPPIRTRHICPEKIFGLPKILEI